MRQSNGPRGVIHGPDAAGRSQRCRGLRHAQSAIAGECVAVCSPARRTRETAAALGLDPIKDANFREQDIGTWTGRRHNDLLARAWRCLPDVLEIAGK